MRNRLNPSPFLERTMANSPVAMKGLFDSEYFDIESSHVNDTFRIFIGLPSKFEPEKQYPGIFALDGNASFAALTGTQRMLTQGAEVPPSIVIGIGYIGDSLSEAMANRNRDYVPTDPGEYEFRALGGKVKAGGVAFLRFIQEELKPCLTDRYPLDLHNCTLQGISLGGLFATWVLLTEPENFKNYILGSPAIWWRSEQVWEWEEEYAGRHENLSASVFISAGALEEEEHLRASAIAIAESTPAMREYMEDVIAWNDKHGWPNTAELTIKLASRLASRNYHDLSILCHNMPDENHMSAPPSIGSRGLRYVYGSWRPEK